jgi:hypothetical protein
MVSSVAVGRSHNHAFYVKDLSLRLKALVFQYFLVRANRAFYLGAD